MCYLISIVGVIVLARAERKALSIYHAKQGLVLFLAAIVVVAALLKLFAIVLGALLIVIAAKIGMINSLSNRRAELPGRCAKAFRF